MNTYYVPEARHMHWEGKTQFCLHGARGEEGQVTSTGAPQGCAWGQTGTWG